MKRVKGHEYTKAERVNFISMKRFSYFLGLLVLLTAFSCSKTDPQHDLIYQTSTIKVLLEGHYDGDVTFEKLATKGDFGLGTFNELDGEMIALDGQFYQVKADGKAYKVAPSAKTPFSVMTFFQSDTSFTVNATLHLDSLLQVLDETLPTLNSFYAIRIEGDFSQLKTRSVPAQKKPYRPLAEVVEDQSIFSFSETTGTMVGFRFPSYTEEINVPGYHLHFITSDRTDGGHVLDLEHISAIVSIDFISNLHLELPSSEEFRKMDLSQDREEELEKVEKLREDPGR